MSCDDGGAVVEVSMSAESLSGAVMLAMSFAVVLMVVEEVKAAARMAVVVFAMVAVQTMAVALLTLPFRRSQSIDCGGPVDSGGLASLTALAAVTGFAAVVSTLSRASVSVGVGSG